MSTKHDNLRDNIGQIIADYAAEHMNPGGQIGIDWLSSRDIDPLADKIVALLPSVPDFDALADKRMSELTPAEQDDAKEGWLRKNVRYFDQPVGGRDPQNHIEFLLKRIDQLRGVE